MFCFMFRVDKQNLYGCEISLYWFRENREIKQGMKFTYFKLYKSKARFLFKSSAISNDKHSRSVILYRWVSFIFLVLTRMVAATCFFYQILSLVAMYSAVVRGRFIIIINVLQDFLICLGSKKLPTLHSWTMYTVNLNLTFFKYCIY